MNYLITSSNAESGTIETLPETADLILLNATDLAKVNLRFSIKDKVAITSESAIELVLERMDDATKVNAILSLKDKFKFRQLLAAIYPNYTFQSVALEDIPKLSITEKAVIKPAKGCFGAAVKMIDKETNLNQLLTEIKTELDKNGTVFSEAVLSKNEFILEAFIEGEEYAIDMFYDGNGQPQITNIYYHPIPKQEAYLHMVYCINLPIFQKYMIKRFNFSSN